MSKQPAPCPVRPTPPCRLRPLARHQRHGHHPSNERRILSKQMTTLSHIPQNAHAHASTTAYPGSQDALVPPVIPSSHPSQVCENTVAHRTSLKHAVSLSNTISNNLLLVSCYLTITIIPHLHCCTITHYYLHRSVVHTYRVPRTGQGCILSLVHYLILVYLNYTISIY